MKKRLSEWASPLSLLAIAVFSYGVFAFQQGFHWDDWGFSWLIQTLGRPGLIDYFATNRPFLANVYSVTTALFGTSPWAWHLFSLLCRWLTAISLLWLLRTIWPDHNRTTFLTAVFFLVYPGFNQQAIAITYSHFFLAQTCLWVSIGSMIKFAQQPQRFWWAGLLGIFLAAFNLFSTEYFFGLELLRPIFLWFGLRGEWPEWRQRLKRVFLVYLPFLLALGGYLYWRFFVLGFYLYQPELVTGLDSPAARLTDLPGMILKQWQVASWQAWGQIFQIPDFTGYGSRLTAVYIGVLLVAGVGLYYVANSLMDVDQSSWHFTTVWIGLGLLSMLLAGLPFLVTELPLRLTFPNSRFTLPFALGAAFILVAILDFLPRRANKILVASTLAALAVGLQFNNGYLWREDWQLQKSFFWQMAWRIPEMQPGSILLSSDTPFEYSSDNSLTFPLNLTYAPENQTTEMMYAYFFVSVRLGNELPALEPGLPITQDYLAATFESTSDQMVAVHFSPPGCFRVLHPVYDRDLPLAPARGDTFALIEETGVPVLPRTAVKALPLSNLTQINSTRDAGEILPAVFGPEPARKWCYYFEKADLARQEERWDEVAQIGDRVFAIPYYPDDLSEYLPFIEAYARMGRWEDARDLTRTTADLMPALRPALCAIWQRLEVESQLGITAGQADKMKAELGYCPYP